MAEKFFITGLPRSRTAWWTIATTTDVSDCAHEVLKYTSSFQQLDDLWSLGNKRFRGISDSGLAIQLGRILCDIKPRTLIVQRDPADVMESLVRYLPFRPIDYIGIKVHLDMCQAAIDEWKGHPLVKVVPYDGLLYDDIARSCFEWLMPSHGRFFDSKLMQMNIQVCPTSLMVDLKNMSGHNQWHLK